MIAQRIGKLVMAYHGRCEPNAHCITVTIETALGEPFAPMIAGPCPVCFAVTDLWPQAVGLGAVDVEVPDA